MKKTCIGCKACGEAFDGCWLGYETESVARYKEFKNYFFNKRPLEECPKPKTIKEFKDLKSKRYQELNRRGI